MPYLHSFFNDYSEGAHPQILAALQAANLQQEPGYGLDSFSEEAAALIKNAIQQPEAAVHFVSTGTQANFIALSFLLKPYEAVIAADSGHIEVHETGAVEATGHKVITVPSVEGKITPEAVHEVLATHTNEHMVLPRVVYISQSTELGTIYSKKELETLSKLCQEKNLLLFIDGARLGSALTSTVADFTLVDIANYADAFYIGGTKNGALFGEAIVITRPHLQKNFRYQLKQHGALLAKGRVFGIQFREFFRDTLYLDNARHANAMAQKLARGMISLGHELAYPAVSNQIFLVLPDSTIEKLQKKFGFYVWTKNSTTTSNNLASSVIRLVTSWATNEEAVDQFLEALKDC